MSKHSTFDIFISYSRKDFKEVTQLIQMLKKRIPSLIYWFDITGIESGDEFEEKIIKAIDNSSFVLFAVSDYSIASPWTRDEVMYAKNINKKVIPVLLHGAELKDWFLFKFGRVDCIDSANPLQVEKLITNLSSWTNKPFVPKEESDSDKGMELLKEQQKNIITTNSTNNTSKRKNRSLWWLWLCMALLVGVVATIAGLYVHGEKSVVEDSTPIVVEKSDYPPAPSDDSSSALLLAQKDSLERAVRRFEEEQRRSKEQARIQLQQQDSVQRALEEEKARVEQERKLLEEQLQEPTVVSEPVVTPSNEEVPQDSSTSIPQKEEPQLTPIEQYTKGLDYSQGKNGVSKDLEEAFRWFAKAAESGLADAQCDLAYCYFLGLGTEEDVKKAADWFNRAAQKNHPEAQYMLGLFYEQGLGVEQNERTSKIYYHAAAQQGHSEARKKLTSSMR